MERKPLLGSSDSEDEVLFDNYGLGQVQSQPKPAPVPFRVLAKLVKNGNLLKVKDVIKERNVHLLNSSGWTILHVAAASNNIEMLRLLLEQKRCLVLLNKQDQKGTTPIMVAIQNRSYRTLEALCQWGADPTKKIIPTGHTVLHVVARTGDTTAAQILLKYYSSDEFLNALDAAGDTPLIESVRSNTPVFEMLLQAGADITIHNRENGRTVLHVAVAYNRQSILNKLMKHEKTTIELAHTRDVKGDSALILAVKLQTLDLIQILTDTFNGLNGINLVEHDSVLHKAVAQNRPDILKHLLYTICYLTIEFHDKVHRSPLLYAAELDRAQCLKELLDYGTDYYDKHPDTDETLFHIVAKYHSNKCLPLLMSLPHASWFFDQKDLDRNTPYMTAICNGNDAFLREAFKLQKVELCDYNSEGETPLYYTVKHGYLNVLFALLLSPKYYSFASYKQNSLDLSDQKVILQAETRGDIYATDVYILLKKVIQYPLVPYFPSKVLIKTRANENVFHACALSGSVECLDFMYNFYRLFSPNHTVEDFDSTDILGNTPLLLGAQCGFLSSSCVHFFATHGADLSKTNNEGVDAIQAMFSYNPGALEFFKRLLDSCVRVKKKYYSENIDISVDFRMICPKEFGQMKVVNELFKTRADIDTSEMLQHPIIDFIVKQKARSLKFILYLRLIVAVVVSLISSIVIPKLYVVHDNPSVNYLLFVFMKILHLAVTGIWIVQFFIKILLIFQDTWFTDLITITPAVSLVALTVMGKDFYLAPELSAMAILSSWISVLVFSIHMYTTFTYQIAIYFGLLHNISRQILVLTVIIFAFTLSLFCVYNEEDRFSHIPTSFVYTFIVMLPGLLGDLSIFQENIDNNKTRFHFLIECIVVGSFFVVATIGFVNMLVALAVKRERNLDIDGKLFQNQYSAHSAGLAEHLFNTSLMKWLMKKRGFKFLKEYRKQMQMQLTFDMCDEANKDLPVRDNIMIHQFRSIIFKRKPPDKDMKKECSKSVIDNLHDTFGHLPGSIDNQ